MFTQDLDSGANTNSGQIAFTAGARASAVNNTTTNMIAAYNTSVGANPSCQ
jgi:hypothetical protein